MENKHEDRKRLFELLSRIPDGLTELKNLFIYDIPQGTTQESLKVYFILKFLFDFCYSIIFNIFIN